MDTPVALDSPGNPARQAQCMTLREARDHPAHQAPMDTLAAPASQDPMVSPVSQDNPVLQARTDP